MDAPEVAVEIVTERELVKLPPLGVIVGVATVETATGADTVKVKTLLLVMPPAVALTVTGKFPVGCWFDSASDSPYHIKRAKELGWPLRAAKQVAT